MADILPDPHEPIGASWEDEGDDFEEFPTDDYDHIRTDAGDISEFDVDDAGCLVRRNIWVEDWNDEDEDEDFAVVYARHRIGDASETTDDKSEDPVENVAAGIAAATLEEKPPAAATVEQKVAANQPGSEVSKESTKDKSGVSGATGSAATMSTDVKNQRSKSTARSSSVKRSGSSKSQSPQRKPSAKGQRPSSRRPH